MCSGVIIVLSMWVSGGGYGHVGRVSCVRWDLYQGVDISPCVVNAHHEI